MTECLVNDAPMALDFRPETWGELLHRLDDTLGGDRRVVTAVRFDGVDQPSFREPAHGGRPLAAVTRVEVEAVAASRLVDEALAAATGSLPGLVAGTQATAAAYRTGDEGAHAQLTSLVAAIQSLIALTTASATAGRVAIGPSGAADTMVAGSCRDVETALATLIERHTAGDWPGLADALEQRLAPAITGWQPVLESIRPGAAS